MSGAVVAQPASGGGSTPTATKTASYTASKGETVRVDASGSSRTVYDMVVTSASAIVTSATAAFTQADVGSPVYGNNLWPAVVTNPPLSILSVQSATQATLTGNASGSGTITATIGTGQLTVTLPASASTGTAVTVKKMDATSRKVAVVPSGSDTIDGLTSVPMRIQYMSRTFRKDSATTWVVESGLTPLGAQVPKQGVVVNWTGDSISPPQSTQPLVNPLAAGSPLFTTADFLAWAHLLSNGRILVGKRGGVGSERADQIAARIDPDGLQFGGHFCGVTTQTNDAAAGRTQAQFATDITASCDAIVARGQIPILTSGTPVPDGGSPNQRLQSDKYRRFTQAYAARNGWPYVDFYSKLLDISTGGYLAAYDNGDGVHPSPAGKQVMGQALVDALVTGGWLVPSVAVAPQIDDNTKTGNLLAHGLFPGAGTTPTGWTKTGSATTALVTDAAIIGQALHITDTTSSGFTQMTQAIANVSTQIAGHKVAFTGRIKAAGTTGTSVELKSNGATVMDLKITWDKVTPGPWQTFYVEGFVPVDATTLTCFAAATNGGTAVDFYSAQFGVYDLTAAGL